MNIRLTLRAASNVTSWMCDEWAVLTALAALSAEPETADEFFGAVRRYRPDHEWDQIGCGGTLDEATTDDGNWCLIDLDSRTVVAGEGVELPDLRDAFQADPDECGDGFPIVWLDTPADWIFEAVGDTSMSQVERRRTDLQQRRRIDARAILYGRPMLEFVAERCLGIADVDDESCDAWIREVHAEWLMTRRDDLLNGTPREWLLRDQNRIEFDMQHRRDQWSRQGFAPPPLDKDSGAYHFGGFGIVEIVMYFGLMRELIVSAYEWSSGGVDSIGELGERLGRRRDEFLDAPPDDGGGGGMSCRELIETERRRMPVVSDGHDIFDDCPICQAAADGVFGSGPTFLCYDGYELEMEDEFAFSLTESREEWEREQESSRQFQEEFEASLASEASSGEEESVWSSSFVDWDAVISSNDFSVDPRTALGFPLGELTTELNERDAAGADAAALDRAYAEFRRADDPVARRSAAEGFRTCLEKVAEEHADLTARSADLQSRLDEVLRAVERDLSDAE